MIIQLQESGSQKKTSMHEELQSITVIHAKVVYYDSVRITFKDINA